MDSVANYIFPARRSLWSLCPAPQPVDCSSLRAVVLVVIGQHARAAGRWRTADRDARIDRRPARRAERAGRAVALLLGGDGGMGTEI